ncbi:hypothetical protein [Actinomadura rupiterrae]|uniref:hypothetical protein n=1 Tax=Actinomadura rupiterrae TaxID=559627 RepID=UPI0020A2B448|nr:hypothetical protein [Actinomadura rupiterrae]MCP2340144.1 hypothetical protein [Actinomadura rupiterrae]
MEASGGRLRMARDEDEVTAASWVVGAMGEFGSGVRGVMPAIFEAYARILHPALSPGERPVRWAEIGRDVGREVRAQTRFGELVEGTFSALWDEWPRVGEFPADQLPALTGLLSRFTGTPDRCWFCLWDGWDWIPEEALASAPRVRLPHRDYLLYEGPVDAAAEFGQRGEDYFFPQSPNLFWPDDRAWCAATEIDLDSTYVGGTVELVEALLDDRRFEVLPAVPDDPLA